MQLLEYFKDLTLHPKNAKELKGLILQLAVQGKLTQKWREDHPDLEPASVLLEKLEIEKKLLIKDRKIRKEQPLDSIDEDEIDIPIPNSWEITRLGEIGDWGAGATPSRSRSDYYGGTVNWFKSGELNNGIIDYDSEETINELALENSSLRLNKVGDVLIAMYGATIGKTGILAVEGTTNQAVCACTPFSCITNIYLHLLLKALKEKFINQGEGGAQPNISRVKIRNQVFALPPLAEQNAIVEVVNQLFVEVEQLETLTKERMQLKEDFVTSALNQLTQAAESDVSSHWDFLKSQFGTFFTEIENIKKLREAILQLAVQGKLTHHWRNEAKLKGVEVEPASLLLEKIKAEKEQLIKEKKIKKEKPLPPISEDEIPYELPKGWVWCRLGSYAHYGALQKCENEDAVENTWVLELEDVEKGSSKILNKVRFQERDFKSTKSVFYLGDVIYGKLRPYLDKVIVADENGVCTTEMIPIKSFGGTISEYLRWYMKSLFFIEYANNSVHGMRMPRMGTDIAKKAVLSIPPVEEQKAIVEKVNGLMALCDQLEQEIEIQQTIQEQWMKSCLMEVFEN